MPRNLLSPSIFWTFSTPASALYEPCRQSSKPWNWIVYPLTPPAAFFWLTANWMPFWVAWPPTVHTGRSDPILMVPLDPAGPFELPHAKATSVAPMSTVSPLARTILSLSKSALLDPAFFPRIRGWGRRQDRCAPCKHGAPPLHCKRQRSLRPLPELESKRGSLGAGNLYPHAPAAEQAT